VKRGLAPPLSLLEVAAATIHAPLTDLMAVFIGGIEPIVLIALLAIIRPIPIKVGVIKKDFFWRVRKLIGSVCESFASGNIFFVFGGGGKEWVRKHNEERIL